MFGFNIAEAFVRVILNAVKENDEKVDFGPKRTTIAEDLTEIKITINKRLVDFVAACQTLDVLVDGDKVFISEDDNEFDIALSILSNLS